MGKHSEDICEECEKREKDQTLVTWHPNKQTGGKGALLCQKCEAKSVKKYNWKEGK